MKSPVGEILKKGEYIANKCHNFPDGNDSGSYKIDHPPVLWRRLTWKVASLEMLFNFSRFYMAKVSERALKGTRSLNGLR